MRQGARSIYRVLEVVQATLLGLSMHRRIAVFVGSILLAVFLAFSYLGWEAVTRTTNATLDERRATTTVVAQHLDDLIGHARSHLQVLAYDVAVAQGPLEERGRRAIERSHDQLRFFYSSLLVFDVDGRLVAASPEGSRLLNPELQAVVAEALQERSPGVSNLIDLSTHDADDHLRKGILFVTPIVDDGRLIGMVGGEMPFPHPSVSMVAGVLHLGRSGHMEVVDSQGWILSSSNADEVFHRSEHHRAYAPLLQARATSLGRMLYEERHEEGEAQDQAEANEWHIMAFVPLTNVPWGVGLGQTEDETFAPGVEVRDRALLVAAIALLVAFVWAWIGTRSVVQPIRALTRAGERMAAGDLATPVGVAQPDEVGRLAHVLEGMRQRLGRSLEESTTLNQELERRVRSRTRELETSNRHLQALTAVATAAGRGGNRQQVLDAALHEMVDTLGARSGWAFLWDEQHQGLRLVSSYRLPDLIRTEELSVVCQDVGCMQALHSSSIISRPLARCPSLSEAARSLADGATCVCAPIRVAGRPRGTVCLAMAEGCVLDVEETRLLQSVAHQIGVAFENAHLTEEAARLEAARRMELLRAEFLASVSHELRTPLGFIKGFSTTLLREDVHWNDGQRAEFLQIIDEECDRLTELVDMLLDAARLQTGHLRLRLAPVDVREVVQRAAGRVRSSLVAHTLELSVQVPSTILADGARVEQVVLNLVQNAAKYSPDGGSIELRTAEDDGGVRISVLDRGLGIPADEVDRVFEPFYRAGGDVTIKAGGAGLGLAVSRAIVTAHGGSIWAENRPGGGTAMHVFLPYEPANNDDGTDETLQPSEALAEQGASAASEH